MLISASFWEAGWGGGRAGVSGGHIPMGPHDDRWAGTILGALFCEIKYWQPQSWDNLYCECGYLDILSFRMRCLMLTWRMVRPPVSGREPRHYGHPPTARTPRCVPLQRLILPSGYLAVVPSGNLAVVPSQYQAGLRRHKHFHHRTEAWDRRTEIRDLKFEM